MRTTLTLIAAFSIAVAACGKDTPAPSPAASTTAVATVPAAPTVAPSPSPTMAPSASASVVVVPIPPESTKIYAERCVLCHGKDGKGNPPTAAGMRPMPRNLTDAKWQGEVTDNDLRLVIVKGGAGLKKSETMPPNPDLANKPEVVQGLLQIVRGYKI